MGRTRFVLGGGGAMGAYQAGSLLALLEAGVEPDAFYGCSAGALNAAFLAARPDVRRAQELALWWSDTSAQRALAPTFRSHVRAVPSVVRAGGRGILDTQALRALIAANVRAHDLSELVVPLIVTTTCLDCSGAEHHATGDVVDVLLASCSLPGLFAPVRLADGHDHVDGGIVSGVPIQAALEDASAGDTILVLDCGLSPVTSRTGLCASSSEIEACGLEVPRSRGVFAPPVERSRGPLDGLLKAFTVARAVANRASVAAALDDPRVRVLPHVADAWAAGLLPVLPRGPRDFACTAELAVAGREATRQWLRSSVPSF